VTDEPSKDLVLSHDHAVRGLGASAYHQPFNIARAYDEARGIDTPRIWTSARDRAMWSALQG